MDGKGEPKGKQMVDECGPRKPRKPRGGHRDAKGSQMEANCELTGPKWRSNTNLDPKKRKSKARVSLNP